MNTKIRIQIEYVKLKALKLLGTKTKYLTATSYCKQWCR
jgi:hypothetical protein